MLCWKSSKSSSKWISINFTKYGQFTHAQLVEHFISYTAIFAFLSPNDITKSSSTAGRTRHRLGINNCVLMSSRSHHSLYCEWLLQLFRRLRHWNHDKLFFINLRIVVIAIRFALKIVWISISHWFRNDCQCY